MKVLGVHSLTHDAGVAACIDGRIVCALEEERLSRIKHHPGIEVEGEPPRKSLAWVLKETGLELADIDVFVHVGFQGDDFLRLDLIRKRFRDYAKELDPTGKKTMFVGHHKAHAASAYYASGFKGALVLAIDGAGDWLSTSLYVGRGKDLTKIDEYFVGQSLGFMYSRAAKLLGLGDFGTGEGKMVALAAYGKPIKGAPKLVKLSSGRYEISEGYYEWFKSFRCESGKWEQKHKDFSATVQKTMEVAATYVLNAAYEKHRLGNLCIAGGVGLNCKMNGELRRLPWVKQMFVQPASNDGGICIGAAYLGAVSKGEKKIFGFSDAYLGPDISDAEALAYVAERKLECEKLKDPAKEAAKLIADGKVVAWVQGKLEFGPRALGHRSLLGDPRSEKIKDRMNYIKKREPWRPVAPSVIESRKSYFQMNHGSKYMTNTIKMNGLAAKQMPAAVHIDGTARVQVVTDRSDRYYRLIKSFEELTGVPAVLNTSLNRQGEPLCCTIDEAIEFFYTTPTDCLIIGDLLLSKES